MPVTVAATTTGAAPAPPPAPTLRDHFDVDAATGEMLFDNTAAFHAYAEARVVQHQTEKLQLGKSSAPQPCVYIYRGIVYDVTEFSSAHPGGAQIMLDYHGKDVSQVFHDEYNYHAHTTSALNMLLQYRVGRVRRVESAMTGQLGELENYQREELTAYPRMTGREMVYNDFVIHRDRGLVWQVMFLTLPQYMHMINTPIYVPYCRLFDWGLIEFFSRTKFWVVMVLWIPLSVFWTARGVLRDNTHVHPGWGSRLDAYLYLPNHNVVFRSYPGPVTPAMSSYIPAGTTDPDAIAAAQYRHAVAVSQFSVAAVVAVFLFGVALWTFMEYFIHRVIFHFERAIPEPIFDNPLCKLLHLLVHGIHHIIPMDPDRLVFPPALFVVASTLIYNGYGYLMTGSCLDVVAGGVVCGYVLYDEIHYLLHHRDPTDAYFKDLKKYHHAHHYVDDTRGYGISNKFWDIVFGTACKKN
ncbi:Cytochrome b5-like Heme/Steroid binding domain/Fatty acid hydroxylase superfamily [Novymonas esmeraldas]|uniref:Cytochrome b5-like Heme/Steroid binding domain/Fatty acid hydroxylase superfamily n=1 Tax=Novymonas esmeraldas TaxID=1808958 RepID=A0AAW0ENK9_9TRYP